MAQIPGIDIEYEDYNRAKFEITQIRDTIIQDTTGRWRRIRMTEKARQMIIACGTHETLLKIEIPVLHTDTHLAFWSFIRQCLQIFPRIEIIPKGTLNV